MYIHPSIPTYIHGEHELYESLNYIIQKSYIHTHVHPSIHMYIHTYVPDTHTHVHPSIHTSIHPYIYAHVHTYIHTYTCMYAHCKYEDEECVEGQLRKYFKSKTTNILVLWGRPLLLCKQLKRKKQAKKVRPNQSTK